MLKMQKNRINRRLFLKVVASAGLVGLLGTLNMNTACSHSLSLKEREEAYQAANKIVDQLMCNEHFRQDFLQNPTQALRSLEIPEKFIHAPKGLDGLSLEELQQAAHKILQSRVELVVLIVAAASSSYVSNVLTR